MDMTIEALKQRRRDIEIDVALAQGALAEINHIIAEWERRRGGRPRSKPADITIVQREATDTTNGPSGVAGALFITPTDDGEAA